MARLTFVSLLPAVGAAALGGVFFCVFFTLLGVPHGDDAGAFSPYRRAVDEAASDLNRRLFTRPPLRGEGLEENAWDHYRRAARLLLRPVPQNLSEPKDEDFAEESSMGIWAGVNQDAMQAARQGTLCTMVSTVVDYRAGYGADVEILFDAHHLAHLILYHARLAWRAGEQARAVELVLDAARLGQDMAAGGAFIHAFTSVRIEEKALRVLAGMAWEGRLSPDVLAQTLDGLAALEDSAYPLELSASSEMVLLLGEIVNTAAGKGFVLKDPSQDLLQTIEQANRLFEGFYEACRRPLPQGLALASTLDDELDRMKDPFLDACGIGFSAPLERLGSLTALRRALGMGLNIPNKESPLSSDDPFREGSLGFRRTEKGDLLVWSAGIDGQDENGRATKTWDLDEPDLVLHFR
jgi:hypothetical protein